MPPTPRERLRAEIAALRERAARAAEAGDTEAAAGFEQQLAPLLVAAGSPAEAVLGLRRALAWHEDAGRELEAARTRYAIGIVQARDPGSAPAARAALTAAAEDFRRLDDAIMEGRAHAQVGALELRLADPAAAVGALAAAAGAFGRGQDLDRLLDGLRLLTFALQLDRRPEEAYRWLVRAFEIAREAGADAAMVLALDLRSLAGSPLAGEAEPDGMAELLRRAAEEGSPAVRAYALLTRAGDEEDPAAALEAAGAARQLALDAADPVVYLMACLQLAGHHDEAGERAEALTTLFTCAATLADLVGEAARAPVFGVIDALRSRWGEAAYQEALAAHRARVS